MACAPSALLVSIFGDNYLIATVLSCLFYIHLFILFNVIPDEIVLFNLLCFTMVFSLFFLMSELLLYCIIAIYYYFIVFLFLGTLPFFCYSWCYIYIYIFVIDGISAILLGRWNMACMKTIYANLKGIFYICHSVSLCVSFCYLRL